MKVLRILNRINTLMLFAYIPFILTDYDNFFNGKTNESAVTVLCLVLFFTTFICGGAILVAALKKGLGNDISVKEILSLGTKKLCVLGVNLVLACVPFIIWVKSELLFFYLGCTAISHGFVIAQAIILDKIDMSPYYKITLPWYVFPVPFVYFIASNIWAADHVAEQYVTAAVMFNFILSGLMLAYCAWHFTYTIDESAKTIEKEYGVLSFCIPNKEIRFERLHTVTKKGLFYTVSDGDTTFKIGRYMSGAKRLEKVLKENGVFIADSKLL